MFAFNPSRGLCSLLTVPPSTEEDITSKRVVFYGILECVVYLVVCFAQVFYIKSLLDSPRKVRAWA